MTRVLSVASECAPLVKTGGLADVVGALPAAMAPLGDELRTLLPGYPSVLSKVSGTRIATLPALFGGPAHLIASDGILVLDAPHLFDRPGGIYIDAEGADWPDNPQRFAALSYAAAHIAAHGADGWVPQLVHGHDWQAGLVPEYLAQMHCDTPFVLTVHNVAFHGNTGGDQTRALQLDPARFTADHYEFWGQISALKAGLMGATQITTVSQTYAEELMTPEFGMGMDGVLRHRRADLTGIGNGIDTDVWNPATDPLIKPYTTLKGKAANKAALQMEFGLPKAPGPLCVLVSRLTDQKGIDLLLDALHVILQRGGQVAVLGSGDPALEVALLERADAEPNLAVKIGYDEALSHRMMAGGDCILVPSRFEPCGLTQLYGLRYGTIPLVALTGGLADTVVNASPAALAAKAATGVQIFPITAEALANGFNRLADLYGDRKVWTAMVRRAMKAPVGWDTSAARYHALYEAAAGNA